MGVSDLSKSHLDDALAHYGVSRWCSAVSHDGVLSIRFTKSSRAKPKFTPVPGFNENKFQRGTQHHARAKVMRKLCGRGLAALIQNGGVDFAGLRGKAA